MKEYTLNDFYFNLPDNLIAQNPTTIRDNSNLFILDKNSDIYKHTKFNQLDKFLYENDTLVFNNAKVISARIYMVRESGGRVEVILTKRISEFKWLIISNRTKKLKIGETIYSSINNKINFTIIERLDEYLIVQSNINFTVDIINSIGEIPLPPYIKRDLESNDKDRYQTIYATENGAVAAPTAGLHFTNELLKKIKNKNINIVYLTLYVSWGTFQPVREDNLKLHKMHSEAYHLPEETARIINTNRSNGNRIIAVGTTSLRVLESTFNNGKNISGRGETDIFIYPPYEIKSIDGLITNFHTPYSTLLMLVAAYTGYDKILKSYSEAIRLKYRFFSYGDSMLII